MFGTHMSRRAVQHAFLVALLACCAVLYPDSTRAATISLPFSTPPAASGFPVTLPGGAAIYQGSPTLADVTGDGKLTTFVGGSDAGNACLGRLYAVGPTGTVLWDIQTRAPIDSTPAVADIDGDGRKGSGGRAGHGGQREL